MGMTLLVTNDFPPRAGGIQTYLDGFTRQLDPSRLVVFCSSPRPSDVAAGPSAAEWDAAQPFTVVRAATTMMLPTPAIVKRMQQLIRRYHIRTVWFGASAPLGIMAGAARRAGALHVVATTHGHEIGWTMVPGAHALVRHIFHSADTVTYLTKATLRRLAPSIGATHTVRMPGGIDPNAIQFSPRSRAKLRKRYAIADDAPVVVCISRLVARKGQDSLIRVWPRVHQRFPRAHLVIVGKGPYEQHLRRMIEHLPSEAARTITLTGEVKGTELSAHYSLGDVFAMPCRTRFHGLDIEGLGLVYLEAYSAGLPVLAGDSGGAPEAVIDGTTGVVAAGHHDNAIYAGLCYLLEDPERARAMGKRGHQWIHDAWTWQHLAKPLHSELAEEEPAR